MKQKERNTEYKICVSKDDKQFLLTLKTKEENHLLKADKVTRVTPVQLVKDALNSYATSVEANIIFSNTQDSNLKVKATQEYLKDIDYFGVLFF